MPTITVRLNGTSLNPFRQFGLTQNPFPQLAVMESDQALLRVQALGGEPIPSEAYIRDMLEGYCTQEFIELCVNQFKAGVYTEFDVVWND